MDIRFIMLNCATRPTISVGEDGTKIMNAIGASVTVTDTDGVQHYAGILSAVAYGHGYDTVTGDRGEWIAQIIEAASAAGTQLPLYFISSVTVHEQYRGNGIGKAMMALFLDLFPGTHALLAETAEKPWLKEFYESLGFGKIFMYGNDTAMIRNSSPAPAVTVRDGKILI